MQIVPETSLDERSRSLNDGVLESKKQGPRSNSFRGDTVACEAAVSPSVLIAQLNTFLRSQGNIQSIGIGGPLLARVRNLLNYRGVRQSFVQTRHDWRSPSSAFCRSSDQPIRRRYRSITPLQNAPLRMRRWRTSYRDDRKMPPADSNRNWLIRHMNHCTARHREKQSDDKILLAIESTRR